MSRTTEITLTPAEPIGTRSAPSSAASASTKAGGRVRETAIRGRSEVRSGTTGGGGGAERLAERGLATPRRRPPARPDSQRATCTAQSSRGGSENSRVPSSGSTIQTRSADSRVALSARSQRLLGQHRVVGPVRREQLHQQLVGGLVAGVLELAALETLARAPPAAARPRPSPATRPARGRRHRGAAYGRRGCSSRRHPSQTPRGPSAVEALLGLLQTVGDQALDGVRGLDDAASASSLRSVAE